MTVESNMKLTKRKERNRHCGAHGDGLLKNNAKAKESKEKRQQVVEQERSNSAFPSWTSQSVCCLCRY